MTNIKKSLFKACYSHVENKYQTIQNRINEIQESLLSETKSSVGDKHETGRAMLQLEREKAGNQLAEIEKMKQILFKINVEAGSKTIGIGSVVFTSLNNFFIAVSVGELKVENSVFYAISANTPIAKILMGKQVDDAVIFNEQKFKIIKVY